MSSLPAVWAYILPALDHIMRSEPDKLEPPPLDVNYHMGVYTIIYNYATSSKSESSASPGTSHSDGISGFASRWARESSQSNRSSSFKASNGTLAPSEARYRSLPSASPTNPSDTHTHNELTIASQQSTVDEHTERVRSMVGYDLYVQLEEYLRNVAKDIRNAAPFEDSALPSYYLHSHARFTNGLAVLNGLFSYLNRHFITRAAGEGLGWVSMYDIIKERRPTQSPHSHGTSTMVSANRQKKSKKDVELVETRKKELLKQHWDFVGGSPEQRRAAEACAEAGSSPDRIVPIASLGHRCWRLEVVEPFLSAGLPKHETSNLKDRSFPSTSTNTSFTSVDSSHSNLPSLSPSFTSHLTVDSSASASASASASKSAKKNKKRKEKARERVDQQDPEGEGALLNFQSLRSDRDEMDGASHSTSTASTRPTSPLLSMPPQSLPLRPLPDPKGRLNRVIGELVLKTPRDPSLSESKSTALRLAKSFKLCGIKSDHIARRRLEKFLKG